MMQKNKIIGKPYTGKPTNPLTVIAGNRPPSASNRVIMNAATGQKIGLGGTVQGVSGVGGLAVASASMAGAPGVTGMGIAGLSDPNKTAGGMLNFNI